jgi:hypothetical protein
MSNLTVCDNCGKEIRLSPGPNWELTRTDIEVYDFTIPPELHLCEPCGADLLAPVLAKFASDPREF